MFDDLKKQNPQNPQTHGPIPNPSIPPSAGMPSNASIPIQGIPASALRKDAEDILQDIEPASTVNRPRGLESSQNQPPVGLDFNIGKSKPPQFQPQNVSPEHPAEGMQTPSIQTTPLGTTPQRSGVEDILSTIEKTEPRIKVPSGSQGVVYPTSASPQGTVRPDQGALSMQDFEKPKKSILKIIILIFVSLLVLAGIGFGGWFVYSNFLSSRSIVVEDIQNNSENQNTTNTNLEQPTPVPVQATPTPEIDNDFDGISDREEILYGTDPTSSDTDGDGLTDRDEIRTFKTDPINPDTDGDTYLDQEEIINGYDPKGPGRLSEF